MIPKNTELYLALALSLLLAVGGCKKAAKPPTPPPPTVTVSEVKAQTAPIIRTFNGTIQAVKTVQIIPQVTGYLKKRSFTEGALVKEGDPLYLIDPRPFEAALAEAQAQLEDDQASADFYAKEAARYEKAEEKAATSVQLMQQAQASLAEAKATVAKDKAAIESAKLNLEYTNITAPFTGRIQTTQENIGALVTAEQTVLTTLVQIDPIYVEFSISRREMFELQGLLGSDFLFDPEVRVSLILPDGKDYGEKGKIDFAASQVNPLTDSVLVRAVIPNKGGDGPDLDLVSGQYAQVNVFLAEQPNAIVIPREALIQTQSGPHVYVVGADNKAEMRMIELDRVYAQYQIVRSGLKPGEKVIVSGLQSVKDGLTVKPQIAADPAASSPSPSPRSTPTSTATPATSPESSPKD